MAVVSDAEDASIASTVVCRFRSLQEIAGYL